MNLNQNQTESLQVLLQKIEAVYPAPCYISKWKNYTDGLNQDARLLSQMISNLLSADEVNDFFLDEIKAFLSNRWEKIKDNSELRYDAAFYIPLNQFIAKLCDIIKPFFGISKYELMNPELTNTYDIVTLCDVDDFMLHQILFCGTEPNSNFIDLEECLRWSAHSENQLHQLLHCNLPGRPELSAEAINLISQRDQWSSNYINSIKNIQSSLRKVKYYNELIKLANALEQTERDDSPHAPDKIFMSLYDFFLYFNELPEDEKNEIDELSFNSERQYSCLQDMNTFKKIRELLVGDWQQPNKLGYSYGTTQLSESLKIILDENLDKFVGKSTVELISDMQGKLEDFIEINHIQSDIITGFLENNDELILDHFTNYLQEPSGRNKFLLSIILRTSILYQNQELLQTLVTQAIHSDSFEFTGGFLKDLLLYTPVSVLQSIIPHIDIFRSSDIYYSFLLLAMISKRIDVINVLLELHPNLPWVQVNPRPQQAGYNCQLIEYCIDKGMAEITTYLLHNGADTDITTDNNRNKVAKLYYRALNNNDPNVLRAITDFIMQFPRNRFQPSFELHNFRHQLERVIKENNTEIANSILSVIRPDEIIIVALHAIELGNTDILTLAFNNHQIDLPRARCHSIDPNALLHHRNTGETLLTYAIKTSSSPTETVRCLINLGADVNRPSLPTTFLRKTLKSYPLIDAAIKNDRETVALLLSQGADESVTDYKGNTYQEYLNEQPNLEGEDLDFEINPDPFKSCP